nr:MAG TPA: hypothetical protein [Caudoviricetes sp.]DAX76685.1 MAG TPA: hypothetical protein [Caudoviricetes sp.]
MLTISILLTVFISSLFFPEYNDEKMGNLVNTIYTISGIMFSIGMGVICTFNPSGIKNENVYSIIENNIFKVRSSFLFYFALSTILVITQTIFHRIAVDFDFIDITIILDAKIFTLVMSIIAIIYYIINFQAIQKLNLDIAKRIIQEEKLTQTMH